MSFRFFEGSGELAKKFSNERDVIAGDLFAERLRNEGFAELADKIQTGVNNSISAWEFISDQLSEIYPVIEYDFNTHRWHDVETGQFVKSPQNNADLVDDARLLGLLD